MKVFCLLACLLLTAGVTAGAEKTAGRLFKEGQKAERAGDIVRAYLLYSQAVALDPANTGYWLRTQALRPHAALLANPKTEEPDLADDGGVPEVEVVAGVTDRELAKVRRPQPPMELKASEGRKDLDFRGNGKTLFERVARAYGLDVVFDWEYEPGASFRFRLEEADYRQALRALEAATDSFIVPLGKRLFLVAKDTPQKRAVLEPSVSVAIPVPQPVSLQEAQELVRAVQQAMALQRFTLDSQRRIVVMRDRVSKVRPAQELFRQLLRNRPQVSIEVEFLEASRSGSTSYGVSLPTLFPLVNFGDLLNSTPTIPAGFTRFAVFGGGKTFLGLGVTDAQVFARMSRSIARSLLKTEIRSLDGQEASVHVGDKFPIITSAFLTQIGGGQASVPPAFTFEDLGLVLKVTPQVHGMEEVSLDVEAEFKVLTGESLNGIPVIATRRLQSQVRLRNGEWAVVAGLMSASEARTITGPAGLSRLPVLGHLFRDKTRTRDVRDLLLILKPTLLSLPPDREDTRPVWVGTQTRPLTPL
jgi:hypothetical protein